MKINIDQICTYNVHLKKEEIFLYEYKKKKSFFGIITQHEGFYENNVLSEDLISNKEILDKGIYVIEDNKVYHKPHISMIMSNKKEYNKYFDTIRELNDFIVSSNLDNFKMKEI